MASELADAVQSNLPDKFYIWLNVDHQNPGCFEISLHENLKGGQQPTGSGEMIHSKKGGAGVPHKNDIVAVLKSKVE